MKTVTFQKDALIFPEGADGNSMFEVLSGAAAIYAAWNTPEQRLLTTVKQGGIFGEMAVLEDEARSATAVAAEETRVLEVPAGDLRDYLQERPERLMTLMRALSARIRARTADCEEVRSAIIKSQTEEAWKKEGFLRRMLYFAGFYDRGKNKQKKALDQEFRAAAAQNGEGSMLSCPENAVIFRQGDKSAEMFILREGSVGIYSAYGSVEEKLLTTLEPGTYFGEMGMIDSAVRSATAVSLAPDTKVERFTPEDLDRLLQTSPEVAMDILRHLSARLRKLTADYMEACRDAGNLITEIDRNRQLGEEAKKLIASYASAQSYTNYY